MNTFNLLRHFGLFVVENFLDEGECLKLRSEMSVNAAERAGVFKNTEYVFDEKARRTKSARVSETTRRFVASRLRAIMPDAERHFGLTLTDIEEPQFLVYKLGDFFRPHRDKGSTEAGPAHVMQRAVSLVVLLNDQRDESGENSYGGGSLVLYGLGSDPRLARIGFPVRGETGLLIAFNSELFHEVTPVAHGERFTIVSWFN